ncbi:MAG: hypothetical protein FWH29_04285 [Methanobrevibacter sp.]|nr:hypothetical protein [Methanobrevibacter sp.]MCL2156658.1 hypothetical protein [Methanobrevibacter sp.]
MSGTINNDLVKVLMATIEAIKKVKNLCEIYDNGMYDLSPSVEMELTKELKDLENELAILKAIYNMLTPIVKKGIENIVEETVEGDFEAYNDYISYETFYNEFSDEDMRNVEQYLGMKYSQKCDSDFGINHWWTNDIEEI